MAVISLTTDFGVTDEYVGVMKGVILSIDPVARIVDLCHHIPPQDTMAAALMIRAAYTNFPLNTIHVVVVDPGVGSGRKIIAVKHNGHLFVAPDNGVLTGVVTSGGDSEIVQVENGDFYQKPVSHTFHGRDIMAPAAAHLSKGVAMKLLGRSLSLENIVTIHIPASRFIDPTKIEGTILAVDHFGNLMTNIHATDIMALEGTQGKGHLVVELRGTRIQGVGKSYCGAGGEKHPLAVLGSRGFLEIAVNKGNAQAHFSAEKGDQVIVFRD